MGWPAEVATGDDGAMIGAAAIVVVLVIAIPVGVLVSGALASAILGFFLKDDVERSHEGSELVATNR